MEKMKADTTIDEIHEIRREISERFGGDVYAIALDAARRQIESNRPIWHPNRPNKSLHPSGGAIVSGTDTSTPAAG